MRREMVAAAAGGRKSAASRREGAREGGRGEGTAGEAGMRRERRAWRARRV